MDVTWQAPRAEGERFTNASPTVALGEVRGILAAARTRRERNPWLGDFVADLGGPDPATAD